MIRNIFAGLRGRIPAQICRVERTHSTAALPIHTDAEKLQEKDIESVVKYAPQLANVPRDTWCLTHSTFLNHGLGTTNFLRIVSGNPKVLLWPQTRIQNAMEHWRSCQFGEYFLFLLITKYPALLDINNADQLLKHVNLLLKHVNTRKNVWKLLMNCPDILQQSLQQIEEKFIYFKEEMRLDVPEIVKSEAFSKSLFEIQCRVVFAERLSLFKPRPLKADPDAPTRNPRLYKITDTSDKTFATKVCHVPLEEFEVFQELYKREVQRLEGEKEDQEDYHDDEGDYEET